MKDYAKKKIKPSFDKDTSAIKRKKEFDKDTSAKKAKKSKKDKKAKRKSFIGAKFDSSALLENQKVKDVLKKKKKK